MLFIQLLHLTIDYSEYHTLIDMKVGQHNQWTTLIKVMHPE